MFRQVSTFALVLVAVGSVAVAAAAESKVAGNKTKSLPKELTVEAVMGNNPSRFNGPKNPVEQVSWDECQEFLGKLNSKTGKQCGKFVLPTEAQWEYACRAGTKTRYSFGDDEKQLGDYAWYGANSGSKTHPVGQKKPNGWGLYDMHGNAWQAN
jgi:eukaryotic-like serine/threonine-protein kinase